MSNYIQGMHIDSGRYSFNWVAGMTEKTPGFQQRWILLAFCLLLINFSIKKYLQDYVEKGTTVENIRAKVKSARLDYIMFKYFLNWVTSNLCEARKAQIGYEPSENDQKHIH